MLATIGANVNMGAGPSISPDSVIVLRPGDDARNYSRLELRRVVSEEPDRRLALNKEKTLFPLDDKARKAKTKAGIVLSSAFY
jgi:hypothetical protein